MDRFLSSSELEEPDPSSPLCVSSECEEPDTESDFSPPGKNEISASRLTTEIISPASSSLCCPDTDDSGSEDELDREKSKDLSYYENLQHDLDCWPLEEDKEDREDSIAGGEGK